MACDSFSPLPFFDDAQYVHQNDTRREAFHPSSFPPSHGYYYPNGSVLPTPLFSNMVNCGTYPSVSGYPPPHHPPPPPPPFLEPGLLSGYESPLSSTSSTFTTASSGTPIAVVPPHSGVDPISFYAPIPTPPDHYFPPSEDMDDSEDAWNLVPYDISWGPSYHDYASGRLPGPDGECLFLRSRTPVRHQRTSQACEKCRERKAKCSGDRPECNRCASRGHVCVYAPEQPRGAKRRRNSDSATSDGLSHSPSPSPHAKNIPLPGPRATLLHGISRSTHLPQGSDLSSMLTAGDAAARSSTLDSVIDGHSCIAVSQTLRRPPTRRSIDGTNMGLFPSAQIALPSALPIHALSPISLSRTPSLPQHHSAPPMQSYPETFSHHRHPHAQDAMPHAPVACYPQGGYLMHPTPPETNSSSSSTTSPSISVHTPLSEGPSHPGIVGFDTDRSTSNPQSFAPSVHGVPTFSLPSHSTCATRSDGGNAHLPQNATFHPPASISAPHYFTPHPSQAPSAYDWQQTVPGSASLYYMSQLDGEADVFQVPPSVYRGGVYGGTGVNTSESLGGPPPGAMLWDGRYPVKREEFY